MLTQDSEQKFIREFVKNLIILVTGRPLEAIKPEAREKVAKESIRICRNYIHGHVLKHYGQEEYDKFKARLRYGDLAFDIYPDLKAQVQEAMQAFIKLMQEI